MKIAILDNYFLNESNYRDYIFYTLLDAEYKK
jgi:hypothetical protein